MPESASQEGGLLPEGGGSGPGGCLLPGGVLVLGGWCAWSGLGGGRGRGGDGGCGVPGPGGGWCAWSGGCLVQGGCGVPGLGGCLVRVGVCLVWGVVSAPRGVGIPVCTKADTPRPPVNRQTPVKILPWPNFVVAGN